MIPREWESGDTYGMNTRPIAFADFRDPRAQQYVHERVRSSRVLHVGGNSSGFRTGMRSHRQTARQLHGSSTNKSIQVVHSLARCGGPLLPVHILCVAHQSI